VRISRTDFDAVKINVLVLLLLVWVLCPYDDYNHKYLETVIFKEPVLFISKCPQIEASSIDRTQQSRFHLMTTEEPSLETLWLKNIRTMDKVQITDPSLYYLYEGKFSVWKILVPNQWTCENVGRNHPVYVYSVIFKSMIIIHLHTRAVYLDRHINWIEWYFLSVFVRRGRISDGNVFSATAVMQLRFCRKWSWHEMSENLICYRKHTEM
jgi:hypothetical protein